MMETTELDQLKQKAQQGDGPSQMTLAVMFESGIGVPRDLMQAYCWYQRAHLSQVPEANAACERLQKLLAESKTMVLYTKSQGLL